MSDKEFFERLKENPRPVVVDFWAPWCGPCRAIEPVMKKLGADYADRVDVWKINADDQPNLLRSLHIYGIPTLVAYKDGQEVARRTGAASPATLSTLFDAALSGDKPVLTGLPWMSRLFRLVIGALFIIIAIQGRFSGWYLLAAVIGAAVAFSAVYDRCPIYRVITSRLSSWLRKDQPEKANF
jgi:thioredoxin